MFFPPTNTFVQQTEKFEKTLKQYKIDSRLDKSSKLKFNIFPYIPMVLRCQMFRAFFKPGIKLVWPKIGLGAGLHKIILFRYLI